MHKLARRAALAVAAAFSFGAFAPAVGAMPLLSELFYDAVGSDDGQSFVEISGTPGTLLDGFLLEGVNGSNGEVGPTVTLSGSIGGDGLFVVGDRRSDGSSDVGVADLLANFDLQNGPDSVRLVDDMGSVLDALAYGEFGPGEIAAGEGAPAPDPSAGSSLARRFADLDTGNNAADFLVLEMPTPGSAPFNGVPEPGITILFGVGLAGLAFWRHLPVR